jgi:hypothetical protein
MQLLLLNLLQASHQAASNIDVDVYLRKSGGSDVEISHAELNKDFKNMITSSLNMEADDILKIQADTSNAITGVVSYALIDRSQENG